MAHPNDSPAHLIMNDDDDDAVSVGSSDSTVVEGVIVHHISSRTVCFSNV